MYDLYLMDGTIIKNIRRLNPATFEIDEGNNDLYFNLNDSNLCIAYLCEGDLMVDIFIDYARQGYTILPDGKVRFKIAPWNEVHHVSNKWKKKGVKK